MVTAAAFRGAGIDARPVPDSSERTLQLGRSCCSGEECFPLIITLGDFLRLLCDEGHPAERAAFFMPTSSGPCRFGQYADYIRMVLADRGFEAALVLSPTSENAYDGLGTGSLSLLRACWRGFVAADHLVAMLLRIRPHEVHPGAADAAFQRGIAEIVTVLEDPRTTLRLSSLRGAAERGRDALRRVETLRQPRPLIGVVGEIFCRNNAYSNMEMIRCLERHGAECWLPGVTEWVHYTNLEEKRRIRRRGERLSGRQLRSQIRQWVQDRDRAAIARAFAEDLVDRPEPEVGEMLSLGAPYLPSDAALGEMALSVARAVYLHRRGVAGVVDISPFTCMNAIVAEAVYPAVSQDCDGVPIRNFYFDGTQANLDRDVVVFLQLARSYASRRDNVRPV
jgi:predicted nucleotide-binding protein (sugar kinase/HSP70/actin superfamily)